MAPCLCVLLNLHTLSTSLDINSTSHPKLVKYILLTYSKIATFNFDAKCGRALQILVTSNDSRMRLYDLRDLTLSCKYKGGANNSSQIKASFRFVSLFIIPANPLAITFALLNNELHLRCIMNNYCKANIACQLAKVDLKCTLQYAITIWQMRQHNFNSRFCANIVFT